MLGHSWIVVCTHSRREQLARHHLERQGYRAYLPLCLTRRGAELIPAPLFPRYLFALLDLTCEAWRPMLSTVGVHSVLLNGDHPGTLSERTVDAIRAREEQMITFHEPVEDHPRYAVGQTVRMLTGAFTGLDAIFAEPIGRNRCALMLQLLGRETRIELAMSDVA